MDNNFYHAGELAMQARAQVTDMASRSGRMIADQIPTGALAFIEQQTMLVVGSMDSQGQVWASVIFGQAGFVRALDLQTLEIDLALAEISSEDPLWSQLQSNSYVGLLLIELASRRRLRVNGRMYESDATHYRIDVKQAYPNCPKYIQRRVVKSVHPKADQHVKPVTQGTKLNANQIAMIASADTFFVASAHPEHGVDASHRGGQPGFVQIVNNQLLRIPDYTGNNMFNTLGNFHSYPHAGLVFVDFQNNCVLQLTGVPKILWPHEDSQRATGGTQRFWEFRINAWRENTIPLDLEWELIDYSRFNPISD